jgi:HK97 gp10 family phage protein
MAEIEIDIRGIAETQRALYQFSEKLGDRVILRALRAGANSMRKQIRDAAPVKTGRMKRATVVATSKIHRRRRDGVVGVYITVRPGKSRTDPKGAYYARFVEHGFKRGSRQIGTKEAIRSGVVTEDQHAAALERANEQRRNSRSRARVRVRYRGGGTAVPARHFISNTFESSKEQSLNIIINAIEQGGQQLLQEMQNR